MSVRPRLTLGNVLATVLLVVALGGTGAIAATQLGKNSVGAKQLKKNAVTAKKIKKNAVTAAKIRNGAVTGAKVADGSLSGADIDAASTSFTRIVDRLRTPAPTPFAPGAPIALGGYTQPAERDDRWLGTMEVGFDAACAPPRKAEAYLLHNPVDPALPTLDAIVGVASVQDLGAGAATRKVDFTPPDVFYGVPASTSPPAAVRHEFVILPLSGECKSGGGVTLRGAGLEVIGTP